MDGIHDLGGKLGFGAVDVNEPEEPFHADYEGRMWAISRSSRAPGINIDWWRHVRENIPADDYLNRSYFDSWAQTEMAALIDAGICSIEELVEQALDVDIENQPETQTLEQVLADHATKNFRFDRQIDAMPKFAVGDEIQTKSQASSGHTRLPAYARDKIGAITAHRGAHLFPDAGAKGQEVAKHLYTVSFTARALWGVQAAQNDTVSLDLWEDYFV
jgi:nitrile hydratase